MPLAIRDPGNISRTIVAIQVRDSSNTPRNLVELWQRDSNNVPRLIWSLAPPMSVNIAPTSVFGFTTTGSATTDPATATPTGGTPPYSYAWTVVSYDGPVTPMADSPTSATSTFTQTSIAPADAFSAVFRCTVTDSTPGSPYVASNTVNASWVDIT